MPFPKSRDSQAPNLWTPCQGEFMAQKNGLIQHTSGIEWRQLQVEKSNAYNREIVDIQQTNYKVEKLHINPIEMAHKCLSNW